ncbi:hypothetical protein VSR01_10680 [Actinacidiphila sp. DG2A-62]|uniref:hypothetical protein n=1 Tax=Actinacidiphila sp. DG2A-62 TaxID=3108821 RepID=UPI002DBAB578|nr:hypothetical protein [Actinacidiphila sp. DG2A-62]MEC3993983.1 hypothetical protein [Actinacidiphila sp. DG2A-62]
MTETTTEMTVEAVLPPLLADILHGLVPLHLARLTTASDHDRHVLAERYADGIAAGADRLTAPGNFQDRHERSEALTALAGGLALGALTPGGVTFAGHHWCTAPHPDCPTTRTKETR